MIDNASRDRIVSLINASVAAGANVLVDGREWASKEEGSWVGPTVLMVNSVDDPTMKVSDPNCPDPIPGPSTHRNPGRNPHSCPLPHSYPLPHSCTPQPDATPALVTRLSSLAL